MPEGSVNISAFPPPPPRRLPPPPPKKAANRVELNKPEWVKNYSRQAGLQGLFAGAENLAKSFSGKLSPVEAGLKALQGFGELAMVPFSAPFEVGTDLIKRGIEEGAALFDARKEGKEIAQATEQAIALPFQVPQKIFTEGRKKLDEGVAALGIETPEGLKLSSEGQEAADFIGGLLTFLPAGGLLHKTTSGIKSKLETGKPLDVSEVKFVEEVHKQAVVTQSRVDEAVVKKFQPEDDVARANKRMEGTKPVLAADGTYNQDFIRERTPDELLKIYSDSKTTPLAKTQIETEMNFRGGSVADFVSANISAKPRTLVSLEEFNATQARLKQKLGNINANPFLDPEFISDMAKAGAYHIESGIRTVADFAVRMKEQFPEHWEQIKDKIEDIYRQSQEYISKSLPLRNVMSGNAKSEITTPISSAKPTAEMLGRMPIEKLGLLHEAGVKEYQSLIAEPKKVLEKVRSEALERYKKAVEVGLADASEDPSVVSEQARKRYLEEIKPYEDSFAEADRNALKAYEFKLSGKGATWEEVASESKRRFKESGIGSDELDGSLRIQIAPDFDPRKIAKILEPVINKAKYEATNLLNSGKIKLEQYSESVKGFVRDLLGKSNIKIDDSSISAIEAAIGAPTGVVEKVSNAIREAKPLRGEQEKLYKLERKRRAGLLQGVYSESSGEAALGKALSTQKGQLPKVKYEPIREKITQEDVDAMHNIVIQSPLKVFEKLSAQVALDKLFTKEGTGIPTAGELSLLEDVFGADFVKSLTGKRTSWEKIKAEAVDALNIPRTVMAAYDMSMPFRQAIIQTTSHPVIASKSFSSMHKTFFSEKAFREVKNDLRNRSNAGLYKEFGLDILDPDKQYGSLTKREESFTSHLAERIPFVGKGVRMSERAAYTYTNKIRADVFDMYAEEMRKAGITPEKNPEHYEQLARWINISTGRGDMGRMNQYLPAANAMIFSPRLIKSRLDILTAPLNPYNYVNVPKEIRVIAMKDMLKFAGSMTALLVLAKAGGAKIETDPRSNDFGKAMFGDTKYDIFGGFAQYVRFAAQMSIGEKKTSEGLIKKLDNSTPTSGNRLDLFYRFGEGKLNPAAGILWDLMRGQSYIGEDIEAGRMAYEHLMPLYLQDMKDAIDAYGVENGFIRSVPSFYGAGASTYKAKSSPTAQKLKDKGYSGQQAQFKGLSVKQALEAYLEMSPEEKKSNRGILIQKLEYANNNSEKYDSSATAEIKRLYDMVLEQEPTE